jgi:very-short-patch-repair endonuclease
MSQGAPLGDLTETSARRLGVFRGREAVPAGVSRKRLITMKKAGAVERFLPDTYRFTAAPESNDQRLHAALAWAGPLAVAAGRSAGETYRAEGVHATKPEVIVPRGTRLRSDAVIVHEADDRAALMARTFNGVAVTGVEATLVTLAHALEAEALEIACENLRRRRLTSVPALRAYLDRFSKRGRRGSTALRRLLRELDPINPSRSTLEVKARRLLVAHGITAFEREFPLTWNGRTYRFDFGFADERVILETNGRRWHDDPTDYEHDNDKWSVPGRLGYRIVFATWKKVEDPDAFIAEPRTALEPMRIPTAEDRR